MARCQEVLRAKPDDIANRNDLVWLRATCPEPSLRNGAEAVELARRANQLSGGNQPHVLDTLAAAYAEAGHFPEAVSTAQQALELATPQQSPTTVAALRTRLALYEAGKPCRQPFSALLPSPQKP